MTYDTRLHNDHFLLGSHFLAGICEATLQGHKREILDNQLENLHAGMRVVPMLKFVTLIVKFRYAI